MNDDAETFLEKALSAAFAAEPGEAPRRAAPGGRGTSGRADPPRAAPEEPAHPARIGRYRVEGVLGRGGMGVVLKAFDPALERTVAIKLLHARYAGDAEMTQRFLDEARIAGGLQHPGVVPVHEVGRAEDGRPYLAMKLVDGAPFSARLAARKDRAADRLDFLSVFERVARIAAYAHDRGVMHLDLKPANILVGAYGEVVLTDWGFAAAPAARAKPAAETGAASTAAPTAARSGSPATTPATEETPSGRTRIVGTPAFMSPEQAKGDVAKIGPRSDVFGLGAILCEILTGAPPYDADTRTETLLAAARGWLDDAYARLDASGADGDLVRLARRCLAPDPAERPADAGEVATAAAAYLRGLDAKATTLAVQAAEARARADGERRRRKLVLVASAAVALSVIGASAAWLNFEQQRVERTRIEDHAAVEATERIRQGVVAGRLAADGSTSFDQASELGRRAVERATTQGVDPAVLAALRAAATEADHARDLNRETRRISGGLQANFERHGDNRENLAKDRAYAEIFRAEGLDVDDARDPGLTRTAAAALRAHRLREQFVDALDDWALVRRSRGDEAGAKRVFDAANAVDGDEWRIAVRVASERKDRPALERLAAEVDAAERRTSAIILLGRGLRRVRATDVSTGLLRRAVAGRPDDYELHHELGTLARSSTPPDLDEAVRRFAAALALRPKSVHARLDLGQAQLQKGELDGAEAQIAAALKQDPRSLMARHFLGVIRMQRKQYAEAADLLREVLREDPEAGITGAVLGSALNALGRTEEARTELARALASAPGNPDVLIAYAQSLYTSGRLPEAAEAYRAALKISPDRPDEWRNLGFVMLSFDRRGAEAPLRECLKRDPKSAEAWCNLGRLLLERGAFTEGRDAIKRGHDLGTARAEWPYPSQDWLDEAERLMQAAVHWSGPELDVATPAEAERLEAFLLAGLYIGRYRGVADLLIEVEEAFDSERATPWTLFAGARAAVRAAAAEGDPAIAAELRTYALEWLRRYVTILRQSLRGRPVGEFDRLAADIVADMHLASVSQTAVEALPKSERHGWLEFWRSLAPSKTASPPARISSATESRAESRPESR